MLWYTPSTHSSILTSINIAVRIGVFIINMGNVFEYLLIENNQVFLLLVEEVIFHV